MAPRALEVQPREKKHDVIGGKRNAEGKVSRRGLVVRQHTWNWKTSTGKSGQKGGLRKEARSREPHGPRSTARMHHQSVVHDGAAPQMSMQVAESHIRVTQNVTGQQGRTAKTRVQILLQPELIEEAPSIALEHDNGRLGRSFKLEERRDASQVRGLRRARCRHG